MKSELEIPILINSELKTPYWFVKTYTGYFTDGEGRVYLFLSESAAETKANELESDPGLNGCTAWVVPAVVNYPTSKATDLGEWNGESSPYPYAMIPAEESYDLMKGKHDRAI